jgi:hypothetical protein
VAAAPVHVTSAPLEAGLGRTREASSTLSVSTARVPSGAFERTAARRLALFGPVICTCGLPMVMSRMPPCPENETEPPNDARPAEPALLYAPLPPLQVKVPSLFCVTPEVEMAPLAIGPAT